VPLYPSLGVERDAVMQNLFDQLETIYSKLDVLPAAPDPTAAPLEEELVEADSNSSL
jgi:hypothetical protein